MKILDFAYIFSKMKPVNKEEKEIINKLVQELGEFTTVKETSEKLKLSKTFIYKMIEEKNIVFLEVGKRKIIYTRSLLVILR